MQTFHLRSFSFILNKFQSTTCPNVTKIKYLGQEISFSRPHKPRSLAAEKGIDLLRVVCYSSCKTVPRREHEQKLYKIDASIFYVWVPNFYFRILDVLTRESPIFMCFMNWHKSKKQLFNTNICVDNFNSFTYNLWSNNLYLNRTKHCIIPDYLTKLTIKW